MMRLNQKNSRFKLLWIVGGLAAVLAVSFLLFMKGKGAKEVRSERPELRAHALTVVYEEVPIYREATGAVTSAYEATLAGKITGAVEAIHVLEGDRVKAGETLITLDSRNLRAQLDRAQAELENATAHYQRIRRLFSDESVSRQEMDNAERAYKVAEAAKRTIEADLADTVIAAPFDGVITSKSVEKGEMVTPGRPLLRIEDDRQLRLESTVSEAEVGAVRVGDKVAVRLDALKDREIAGRIVQILPSADPSTHSFEVKASLPPEPGLKSGLFGRMFFSTGTKKAILLPRSAVMERGALSTVFVVGASGIIESRLVKPGNLYNDRIEIVSGLEPGEKVLERASDGREGAKLIGQNGDGP